MTVGGSYGGDWVEGWRPHITDPALVERWQSAGQDTDDLDGTEVGLAVAGYAADGVVTILTQQGDETRRVPVLRRLNAFVILGRRVERTVTALGIDGARLGRTRTLSTD